jgi:hypothetical protein
VQGQAAIRVEDDLEVVREEAAGRAMRALQKSGTLRPFAITLSGENALLSHEVSPNAAESPSTAVEILAQGMRVGIGPVPTPRAVALVRTVVVRSLVDEGSTAAVCVALEHSEGTSKRWFLPYTRRGKRLSWGEPRVVPGVPWFFEIQGSL